ncbi:MAG TPA: NAD-dependent epimerase/dehydratase family protein, partial [Verrucomicrobiota bacterium]|nr:NAD-dependent epimerase/dehydratase family protein [Verrucomicrobiota bacterium]
MIIGCGYIGLRLARVLIEKGNDVVGTRRSDEGLLVLEANKIKALQIDITEPEQLNSLKEDFDWVINCAAAPHSTVAHYTAVYYQGTANVLNWLRRHNVKKYVYTSSTAVYGQNDGSIVTEESPIFSNTDTGNILIATEELIMRTQRAYSLPAIILRVAGIYGEERCYY